MSGRVTSLSRLCMSQRRLYSSTELQKATVPELYPNMLLVPITMKPLFPQMTKSVQISDPAVKLSVNRLMKSNQPYIGCFLTKDDDFPDDVIRSKDQVHSMGTFTQILRTEKMQNGDLNLIVLPQRRVRITELLNPSPGGRGSITDSTSPSAGAASHQMSGDEGLKQQQLSQYDVMQDEAVSRVVVSNVYDEPYSKNPLIKALTTEILSCIKDLIRYNPQVREQVTMLSLSSRTSIMDDPALLADFSASISQFAGAEELQQVLESMVIEERLQKVLVILKKELSNAKLQEQIDREVEEKMNKARKEYYLMEHMKGIQKELGIDSDGKDKLVLKFKDLRSKLQMPEEVSLVFDEELNKFMNLDSSSMEFNVSRNYLDWLTSLPWGKQSVDSLDIERTRQILDHDHYKMKDVKERILEFVAVSKLNSNAAQGKILCLSGPPGVGKTSIGKSIAKALNREFYRFSVGGLGDVSEIKGHRRTYVGALPGKIVQALKKVQTENPLILIDEVDKIGRSSFRGDPSSALLEVLDPEQNSSFMDHYLDVPLDLSKALFMCTANVLDTIPGPLLDRMEVIELSGYVTEEKVAIANQYLMDSARKNAGVTKDQVELTPESLVRLINEYCRESGVRNLKKQIEKIYRKAAFKVVQKQEENDSNNSKDHAIVVTDQNLPDFVGVPIYSQEMMYASPPAGVVRGLAWTGQGGATLYVECISKDLHNKTGRASIVPTGQLGDVMKESTDIAYTYAQQYLRHLYPESNFFQQNSIHLHVPHGAIKKDGPSAGVTMCTALLSLALNQPVPSDVAMTGELTLTGKVLKIGGVKEKIIAAKRSGARRIIFPKANEGDYEDLEDFIKDGIEAHFVSSFDELAKIVFGASNTVGR
ncbi:hypothetical protein MP228_004021 [Amoeboaphelidium protococcarum]|nr:hypothetical protein MP228_004021 [Amoeboaphelidium protococcarum]